MNTLNFSFLIKTICFFLLFFKYFPAHSQQTADYSENLIIAVAELSANAELLVTVFPDSTDKNNINLPSAKQIEEVLVVVMDITGKESYSKIILTETNEEMVYATDAAGKLVPGVYLIIATSEQEICDKHLIIQ